MALFDCYAAGYDDWYATPAGSVVDRLEKEAVFGLLAPRPGLSVLDVGCGTGNYTLQLAVRGMTAVGVDASPAMLERARKKAAERRLTVSFCLADARELPFADGSFDAVLTVTALEFVPEPRASLREAYRVLKPGGRLVAGVIGRDGAWGRYYAARANSRPDSVFRLAHFFTLAELREMMPGGKVTVRAALFVPPDFDFSQPAAALAVEGQAVGAGRVDGGFVCARAVKPGPGSAGVG